MPLAYTDAAKALPTAGAKDKTLVFVGGMSEIGAATARLFAGLGACNGIVIVGRDPKRGGGVVAECEALAAGVEARFAAADLSRVEN
jgi:NAD(P)-dependent dehydrogenase (short-subunit alcohol dehydrogenase family)